MGDRTDDSMLQKCLVMKLAKHWAFLGLFQSHGKNVLIKNMVHSFVFPRKSQKFVIFWEKCKKVSALEANIGNFQQI